jgi:S1-C subfamily serine protease
VGQGQVMKNVLLVVATALAALPAVGQDGGLAETQKRLRELIAKVSPGYVFVTQGGSGVCISADGWILTNHHVAGGAKECKVWFSGGKEFMADLVGWHPLDDVAVLKVRDGKDLPFVPMGDSDSVKVGDRVIAIGNPFSLGLQNWEPSVAYGIVSALHVYLDDPGYKDAIQTDAQINPGNSGGPLITMKGEVVGINGRIDIKRFTNRVNTGIGYAIPTNQIARFLPHFKAGGRQWGGYLQGLKVGECGDDRYEHTGEYGDGTFIFEIEEGCPADKAGLKEGDILYNIGGHRITNNNRFFGVLGSHPAGALVPIKAKRWNKEKKAFEGVEARVLLGNIEDMKEFYAQAGNRYYGFTPDYYHEGAGFKVAELDAGAPGAKAGLKAGDVILEADGKKLASWVDFRQEMGARKPGDAVKLKVKRGDETLEAALTLDRRDLAQDEVGPPGRRPPKPKDDKKKDEDEDEDEPMQEPKKEQKEEPPKKE